MGPLFLSYHILPPVSTATTSMMSLLNTANSIIHYAIDGKINYSVSVLFFLVGLLAGATGRATALHLLKKYKKKFEKAGLLRELRSRQAYTKKSVRRRSEVLKAAYVQTMRRSEEA